MGLIYLSGPITGTHDYIARFARAQTKLEARGWEVINPAAVIYQLPESLPYYNIMQIDLMLLNICDAIYMMDGCVKSKGCLIEYEWAVKHKKELLYESEDTQ